MEVEELVFVLFPRSRPWIVLSGVELTRFCSRQDLATYRLIGALSNLEIAEVCARSGANCGSLFLDLRFRELVSSLLRNHPVHVSRPLPPSPSFVFPS